MGLIPFQLHAEDQSAARDAVYTLYSALQLPKPRVAFCPSPKTMHQASRMLRTIQYGTAYKMVQALVPYNADAIEREAKVSLLTALIDPDVSTQSGGLLVNMIQSVFGNDGTEPLAISQLRRIIRFKESDAATSSPARFEEQAMYPALYRGLSTPRLYPLQSQTTCIMPFTKICWMSLPPKSLHTDKFGNLHCTDGPAATWSDGFEVWLNREEENPRPRLSVASDGLLLEAGNA